MKPSQTTERLLLRRWRASDVQPFRDLNADPRVMEFMPGALPPQLSDNLISRIERHSDQHGFGLFAAELREDQTLIGLSVPTFEVL